MASMRDIKRRIKSVSSTQQITKAMNLVASSKLNRAKARFNDTKPFFSATQRVIGNVVKGSKGVSSIFMRESEGKKTLVVVVTGDRGLCGGYNSNVCKTGMEIISKKADACVIAVGNKAREFFRHKNVKIAEAYRDVSEKPSYSEAYTIGQKIIDMYEKGEADEVYFVYTEFITTLTNEPKAIKLLPLDPEDFKGDDSEPHSSTLTIYEPDEEAVLDYVIPKYINTVLFGGMVESAVCELSSRMTAMDSATENASEMIEHLNLVYNRVRQGAITQEITEIVSGSNALE